MNFATRAIHVGQAPDPTTGATVPPIYVTSTYTQTAPGEHRGYEYSRTHNPTRTGLQECLAALEGGQAAACFASGLAATSAIITSLLRPGESIVAYNDLYGGTFRLFERVFKPWGLQTRYTGSTDPAALIGLIDATTRLVWIETPTNPMLHLLDIQAISRGVREAERRLGMGTPAALKAIAAAPGVPPARHDGIVLVVDNTFASPALQQPIALGADLVLHSTTKYLGGHSDVVGGAVVAANQAVLDPIRFTQNAAGGVPGPFDCFLTHRGIKTLHIRMRQHCENAAAVARWALGQKAFSRVIYPGLESHPQHALAARQMSGFGGMVTCVLKDGLRAASRFMAATRLFACAESLGGVESLVNHPAIMTHASVPREIREQIGIVDGLVRLSVGIEDASDLIADLEQALRATVA
ncbi:MAG: Cystathionine beta-lyase [Phycisphaerae bacterium]|nr:Cystathionine beta-lyase [Phycisphaerae bacterium]